MFKFYFLYKKIQSKLIFQNNFNLERSSLNFETLYFRVTDLEDLIEKQ